MVAAASLASGIRCVLTPGIFDLPGAGPDQPWQAHLATHCRVYDEMDGREGRLHVGFGPHAAYSLPAEALAAWPPSAAARTRWSRSTWPRPRRGTGVEEPTA